GKAAFVKAVKEAKPLSQFLFSELAAQVDMATEEGRASFVAHAKPLVAQIEAPALAAMLRTRLAEMARLAPAEIDRMMPPRQPLPVRRPSVARNERLPAPAAESRLLGRLLMRPDVVSQIPFELFKDAGADAAALTAV